MSETTKIDVVLAQQLQFGLDCDEGFFQVIPPNPAVFLLRGEGEPYVSKTANLRRRLLRLLSPPTEQSKRLNLRSRVREIEFTLTGSDFESQFLLYRVLRETFPKTYAARLRLRPAPLVKLHLENKYPRASVTAKLGRLSFREQARFSVAEAQSLTAQNGTTEISSSQGVPVLDRLANLYYGPFPSRSVAEKFASDALDFFKMRRCVEDLHPDPAFPGCVYSEMKMCLAPCFKGCTDAEYQAETARVQNFLDTRGESLLRQFAEQRDHASADLAFEEAAAVHEKLEKLKPLLSQLPEIVRRVDRLRALIVQPSMIANEGEKTQSVSLFLFQGCTLHGPSPFSIAPVAESRSMESRLKEAIANFTPCDARSISEHVEHLAILKRWYYRSTRVGEVFFADQNGDWPMRRIARGIGRVVQGEKPQEAPTFSASPNTVTPSQESN